MKCLVTGASGFIGSYLVEFLTKEGHQITALGRVANPGPCQRRVGCHFRRGGPTRSKEHRLSDRLCLPRGCFSPGCSELSECLLETTRTRLLK